MVELMTRVRGMHHQCAYAQWECDVSGITVIMIMHARSDLKRPSVLWVTDSGTLALEAMADTWCSKYGYPAVNEGRGGRTMPAPTGAAGFPTSPEQVISILESVLPFRMHHKFRCSANECSDGYWAIKAFNRIIVPVTPNQMYWLVQSAAVVGTTAVKWWNHPDWIKLKDLSQSKNCRELRWPVPSPTKVDGPGPWRNHLRMAYNDGTLRGCFGPSDSFEAANAVLERAWAVHDARQGRTQDANRDDDCRYQALCEVLKYGKHNPVSLNKNLQVFRASN